MNVKNKNLELVGRPSYVIDIQPKIQSQYKESLTRGTVYVLALHKNASSIDTNDRVKLLHK